MFSTGINIMKPKGFRQKFDKKKHFESLKGFKEGMIV